VVHGFIVEGKMGRTGGKVKNRWRPEEEGGGGRGGEGCKERPVYKVTSVW
jgi:hypothetical protein